MIHTGALMPLRASRLSKPSPRNAILAFVTGMVDQELLARIEYLAAENRILKAQLKGRAG
jgi:hypothetical protein